MRNGYRFVAGVRESAGYLEACEGMRPLHAWPAAVFCELRWLVMYAVCRVTEHRWVDDSHAGPESGCMSMHCERCGSSFHHTLY